MSSTIPPSPEQIAARYGKAIKVVGVLILGYVVSPFILAAIGGLAGLIVGGLICGAVYYASPAIETWGANMRLKSLKAAAAANPIETLQNEYARQSQLLDERLNAIETFSGKIRSFGDKLDGFKQSYPAEAGKYQAIFDQMHDLLARRDQQWKQGKHQLDLFEAAITKAQAIWDMSNAANAARAGSGLDTDAVWAKIKTDTAYSTIQDNMNTALSSLDTLTLESDSIDMGTVGVQATVVNDTPAQAASLPAPDADRVLDAEYTTEPSHSKARASRG